MPTISYRYSNVKNNFVINGWTTDDQITPDVVAIDNGGFAVFYGTDDASFGGFNYPLYSFVDDDYNIDQTLPFTNYGLPYDEGGASLPDLQGAPKITRMTDGNLALVWDEGTGDGGDDDLVGVIVDGETGAIITSEFVVGAAGGYQDPDLAALAGGGFVAVWESASNLRFQTFDALGAGNGIQFITTTDDSSDFHVAGLTDGGFVITWTDNIGGNLASVARIYDANGASRTGEITVGPAGATNQNSQTAVAAMPNGNWAIVYTDSGWSGDGLSLHIYDASGNEVAGPIRIDTDAAAIEADPDVTVLKNGFIFVTWTVPGSGDDILGALFDDTGSRIQLSGSDVRSIATGVSDENFSSVATLDGGQVITSWQDSGTDDGSGGSVQGEVGALIRETVGDASAENLVGDAMIDEIFAGNGNDTVSGGDGDDTLAGGGGNDSLFGQGDDD
ncbi:MAG: calcium-binding protein, partial [Hyphococcus sp.]